MKKIQIILLIFLIINIYCDENYSVIDLSFTIYPIFEYNNFGGYYYIENGELIILEAIYDDSNKYDKPVFKCYTRKRLITELRMKDKIINNSTIYIAEYNPSYLEINSLEEFDKLWEDKLKNSFSDKNNITFKYKQYNCEITIDLESQITNVFIGNNNRKVKIIDIYAFYVWHKIINNYLIIALHSQGGSGHTIILQIYNIEDIIKQIEL